MMKHFITGREFSASELAGILLRAKEMKKHPQAFAESLRGKALVMLFDKPSLRTRLSFSLAMQKLGGMVVETSNLTRKEEPAKDIIRVINQYADALMVRSYDEAILEEMMQHACIPIINALSDWHHPCQILADLMALEEYFATLDNLTITYVGDGNNILHSLLLLAPLLGVKIHYSCPLGRGPKDEVLALIDTSMVESFPMPEKAVLGANAVYTDVWTSMGFTNVNEKMFLPWQVDSKLFALAGKGAVFMHCMPIERGKEVTDEVVENCRSLVFAQSENRLWVQQALLYYLLY